MTETSTSAKAVSVTEMGIPDGYVPPLGYQGQILEGGHTRIEVSSSTKEIAQIHRCLVESFTFPCKVRYVKLTDRLDGHMVQGHVDAVSSVISCQKDLESYILWVKLPQSIARYVAVKGSITLDGTSLTVNEIQSDRFRVNIVPYTAEETLISKYRSADLYLEISVSSAV